MYVVWHVIGPLHQAAFTRAVTLLWFPRLG
jgi:hypothetical protein